MQTAHREPSPFVGVIAALEAKDAEDLPDRADPCGVPELAAQAAALLALGVEDARGRVAAIVARNADRLPSELHDIRREVLSIRECLEAVRGA